MNQSIESQMANMAMLLRDHPVGTSADITEYAVVFWDGERLVGVHLSADNRGQLDEPFDVQEVFPAIEENIADWFTDPRFTRHPNLLRWQQDAPRSESGVI